MIPLGAPSRHLRTYPSERRVFFSKKATTHYGFCVTGAYFSADIYPFASEAQRARFVASLRKRTDLSSHKAFVVAALAALALNADDTRAQAYRFILVDVYPDQCETALAAAEASFRRK